MPTASFSLLVVPYPTENLLGKNVVFIHPNLHKTLAVGPSPTSQLLVINGVAFESKPHPMIQSGTIGLDSMQRSTLCVSKNDLVQVRCLEAAAMTDRISRIKFSILPQEVSGNATAYPTVDKDVLARHIKSALGGQAFAAFQTAIVAFQGVCICVQVFDIETEASDRKLALCMGKHGRLGSRSPIQALDDSHVYRISRLCYSDQPISILSTQSQVTCSFHSEVRQPTNVMSEHDSHSSFVASEIAARMSPSPDGRLSPTPFSDGRGSLEGDNMSMTGYQRSAVGMMNTMPGIDSLHSVMVPEHPKFVFKDEQPPGKLQRLITDQLPRLDRSPDLRPADSALVSVQFASRRESGLGSLGPAGDSGSHLEVVMQLRSALADARVLISEQQEQYATEVEESTKLTALVQQLRTQLEDSKRRCSQTEEKLEAMTRAHAASVARERTLEAALQKLEDDNSTLTASLGKLKIAQMRPQPPERSISVADKGKPEFGGRDREGEGGVQQSVGNGHVVDVRGDDVLEAQKQQIIQQQQLLQMQLQQQQQQLQQQQQQQAEREQQLLQLQQRHEQELMAMQQSKQQQQQQQEDQQAQQQQQQQQQQQSQQQRQQQQRLDQQRQEQQQQQQQNELRQQQQQQQQQNKPEPEHRDGLFQLQNQESIWGEDDNVNSMEVPLTMSNNSFVEDKFNAKTSPSKNVTWASHSEEMSIQVSQDEGTQQRDGRRSRDDVNMPASVQSRYSQSSTTASSFANNFTTLHQSPPQATAAFAPTSHTSSRTGTVKLAQTSPPTRARRSLAEATSVLFEDLDSEVRADTDANSPSGAGWRGDVSSSLFTPSVFGGDVLDASMASSVADRSVFLAPVSLYGYGASKTQGGAPRSTSVEQSEGRGDGRGVSLLQKLMKETRDSAASVSQSGGNRLIDIISSSTASFAAGYTPTSVSMSVDKEDAPKATPRTTNVFANVSSSTIGGVEDVSESSIALGGDSSAHTSPPKRTKWPAPRWQR